MRRLRNCAAAVVGLAGLWAPPALAARTAVIAFVPAPLRVLAGVRGIEAVGLIDPTQGGYNQQQSLLDLTQGAWVLRSAYRPRVPPAISPTATGVVDGWPAAVGRAGSSAGIEPGLLAATIPGGAAYAAAGSRTGADAVVAADRGGRVAASSLGSRRTLAARTRALLRRWRLVVVDVPDRRALEGLLRRRIADQELVLVVERLPLTSPAVQTRPSVLAIGEAGLPGTGATVGSPTTRLPGLVTAIDVGPTVLGWLGLPAPAAMHGAAISRRGGRDLAGLERFRSRLGVIAGRRWPTIETFLLAWLALLGVAGTIRGAGGRGLALRLGGLAALWTPVTVLVGGALAPSRWVEVAVVVGGAFVLAAGCDRLVAWPRAPAVPAAAMAVAYVVDLALGSPVISISLLGSNPIAGSRFFGVGNELEAALPVVLFAGLAAALGRRAGRPAGEAAVFAAAGLVFTGLIAWGRLGADVGAVFTIGGGTAVGALMLVHQPRARTVALACAVPFVGLLALAGLDLVTGAGGHFTGSVLHAGSAGDILDTVRRKLEAAFGQLRKSVMPVNAAVCLAAAVYAVRRPERVLAPVGGAAAWRACLFGGFAGGVLGSLTNDSGPVLLVIATFGLGCVLAYLWGRPAGSYPLLQRT